MIFNLKAIMTLCLLVVAQFANAGQISVIVHPSNAEALDRNTIARIYLGKNTAFPSGATALPVDLKKGSATRSAFEEKVLKKTESQLKAFWAKQVFTGQGQPPKATGNVKGLIQLVSKNPNVIAYVESSEVTDSVKVVATF